MKKLLFGISSIFFGFINFSFAGSITSTVNGIVNIPYARVYTDTRFFYTQEFLYTGGSYLTDFYCCIYGDSIDLYNLGLYMNGNTRYALTGVSSPGCYFLTSRRIYTNDTVSCGLLVKNQVFNSSFSFSNISLTLSGGFIPEDFSGGVSCGTSSSCEDKEITVYYNSGSSTSITCDGVQAIDIQGLSTITYTNTFTPYFNINYRDEDNQLLTESYSKDILFLSGGTFKKTYTGDNFWILNNLGIQQEDSIFSGYLPTFDFTGVGIQDITDSGNIFNNFAENGLKVLLSNIPSYIQYIIIIFLLFFIISIVKKVRK